MYGWERLGVLKHLLEQGLSKSAIARQLGVSRRVIYHWLATGQLEHDVHAPASRRRVSRPTKLDGFTPLITTRLASYPELSAVRLFDELRAAGYRGGITQVRDYVARMRPRPEPEPVTRFETEPGHQAQVDFALVDTAWGRRYAFLVVLGYSRLLWVQFVLRQTMATVMDSLEAAFQYFGGVPRELLFDQMRAVVTRDGRSHGGRLVENAEFLRFAAHWGFRMRLCRPYRAQTKGKVERPVGYLRRNFLYGRDFLGDADLDAQAQHWLDYVANARVHGTTREAPRLRFERDERHALGPLAPHSYQRLVPLAATRSVTVRLPRIACLTIDRRPLAQYTALLEAAR